MEKETRSTGKPFIGVHFKCCKVYARVYLNATGTAFIGWCPRCAAKTTVTVSPTGSRSKFFAAE